jgi:hypothetical protein
MMVTCQICNKEFKQITTSGHLRKHGVDRAEYLRRYPKAQLVSKVVRDAHSKAIRKRVANGTHFVPFRDIEGLASQVGEERSSPVKYTCIQCGKEKTANRYVAERRKFCSNDCNAAHIRENPELYSERNRKISLSNKGKARKGRYSRCRGGIRRDIGHYVRSGWEADICRLFRYLGKEYDYEAYTICLKDDDGTDLYWTFDFVDLSQALSDGLIEVKGWWDDKSKRKLRLLRQQRPAVYNKLTVISQPEMKELIRKYANLIPKWESKK